MGRCYPTKACNWATDTQQLRQAASSSKQQQAVASGKQHAAVATHPGAHGLPAVAAGGIPAHKHSVRTSNESGIAGRERQTPPLGSTCSRGAWHGKLCQAAGQQLGVLAWLWCHASAAVQCMQEVHSTAQHSAAQHTHTVPFHLRLCEWKRAAPLVSHTPTLRPRRPLPLPLPPPPPATLAWPLAPLLRPSRLPPLMSLPPCCAGTVTSTCIGWAGQGCVHVLNERRLEWPAADAATTMSNNTPQESSSSAIPPCSYKLQA